MARYIDAEKIKYHKLSVCEGHGLNFEYTVAYKHEVEAIPTADVVPKSEEGAECPICHGTGRIGTTDWLTKNIYKKQLAEEKAKAIAEHERHIKTEVAREIFEEIEKTIRAALVLVGFSYKHNVKEMECKKECYEDFLGYIAELKKKYTEDKT